jgi:hypothetical protein
MFGTSTEVGGAGSGIAVAPLPALGSARRRRNTAAHTRRAKWTVNAFREQARKSCRDLASPGSGAGIAGRWTTTE